MPPDNVLADIAPAFVTSNTVSSSRTLQYVISDLNS